MAEQFAFVEWWDRHVGVRLHAGSKLHADRRATLSAADAEAQTGISQPQVSRWRKAEKDAATMALHKLGEVLPARAWAAELTGINRLVAGGCTLQSGRVAHVKPGTVSRQWSEHGTDHR